MKKILPIIIIALLLFSQADILLYPPYTLFNVILSVFNGAALALWIIILFFRN